MKAAETRPVVDVDEKNRPAAARSMVYQVFSALFSYPAREETAETMLDGSLQDALIALGHDLPYASPFLGFGYGIEWPGASKEGLEILYTRLFDTSAGRASVSMQEMHYSNKTREVLWEDILRFYNHFGLDFRNGRTSEPPDHLVTELEFMHYLTFLEAGASDDAEPYTLAGYDFLERHLGEWLSGFQEKVTAAGHGLGYESAARMLVAFVRADKAYLASRRN